MKLRVRGDSLRLRLTRGEVERLAAGEAVTERVRFGEGAALAYTLAPDDVPAPRATLETGPVGAVVVVRIPAEAARAWAVSDDEGIEADHAIGDGAALRIVVQKDFACLSPRAGDEDVDTFPHPEAGTRAC